MKAFKKIIIIMLALLMVTGCDRTPKPEEPAYPDRDVSLPTKIEYNGEDSVMIHYQRTDNTYDKWALWLWDPQGDDDSKEDNWNYQDDYGVIAYYPLSYFGDLSGQRLGIIVKTKGSWTKDGTDADRFIDFSALEKDENKVYHIYLAGGDEHMYKKPDKVIDDEIISLRFTDAKTIFINCSNKLENYTVYADGEVVSQESGAGRVRFSHTMAEEASFDKNYEVEVEFRATGLKLRGTVSKSGLYTSDSFNEQFYYDGELGAIYSPASTTFKVWSPVSSRIVLRIYENGTPKSVASSGSDEHVDHEMTKGDKGVFSVKVDGDLAGKYYTYVVYNSVYDGAEVVDPYARGAGVSGLRGMIVDFSKTNPEGWEDVHYLKYDRKELVVWEAHVADVTSSATWTGTEANRKKYLGLIEEGTNYTESGLTVSTGFDHIRELGVNAVQLQPIYDQANDETRYEYNWGYNPLNYNVLEGMYSSDPYDGYARIREFKQVVKAFYDAGITTIMDVVYNHVNSVNGLCFDVLMPEYYFRYNQNGTLSNGSGCGNETASENLMMRKYIIDSIKFWTKEYKLGGFRFDLMGLHDIETMNEVAAEAKKINKNIVIYGEPWTGGGTPLAADQQAIQANANEFVGYGQFNDQMRDALIKGGLNAPTDKGWITGDKVVKADVDAIVKGINGITYNVAYEITDVDKTVNYVTCHDNYTLYDRVIASGTTDEATIRKMCMLANSVVLTSNGTSFMLAGEEMLRTKKGDSNSYISGDEINQIDYSLKVKNHDVYQNYQKLIDLKKNSYMLHQNPGQLDIEYDDGSVLTYSIGNYLVIHCHGSVNGVEKELGGSYMVYLDTLGQYSGVVDKVTLQPYQTLILNIGNA